MIKLMEAEVHVRCRKSDLAAVQAVADAAVNEYKVLLKKEVACFKNKEVPINLEIDTNKFLSEYVVV